MSKMSNSVEPMDRFARRCNIMCNDLWKYLDNLTEHINTLPEGQTKEYLIQLKSLYGMIAELYFFSAVSLGTIRGLEEGPVKALFKEVFKDRTIQLPYEPKEGTTLRDTIDQFLLWPRMRCAFDGIKGPTKSLAI